jgi:uncharacterized protein YbjT (DUF2867 family)
MWVTDGVFFMSTRNQTILVLGATGRQGGAAARALFARGFAVKALTRDPDKPAAQALMTLGVSVVKGDIDEPRLLLEAMHGVDGVFSVQTPYGPGGVNHETRAGIAVAEAAKAAGVAHLVYSSVGGAERGTGIPHFESKYLVEQHIREAGLHATIIRPVFFMENFAQTGPKEVGGELVLRMALSPETRLQMIAVHDIGVFAALAFEGREGIAGRTLEIAGDELSMTELAQTFAAAAGRPVQFQRQPFAELEARNAETAKMFGWFEAGGYQADLAALRRVSPDLETLASWLASGSWTPPRS